MFPRIRTGYGVLLEWDHVYARFAPRGSGTLSGNPLVARVQGIDSRGVTSLVLLTDEGNAKK